MSVEAMNMALETLECIDSPLHMTELRSVGRAITALRAALAEDAMQRLTDVQQEMGATSQESRQVEPVAYVTGYSKGYATVQPIDPCLLMPVGMGLYRSPPTINEMETVEPVAVWELQESGWEIVCDGDWVKELPLGTKIYTAAQRKPLTNAEIDRVWRSVDYKISYDNFRLAIARAIERAHGIGSEE